MPDERVAANFHVVPHGEVDQLVGLAKVERLRIGTQHLPFQSVFWFQHVELAGQGRGIGRFGKLRGTGCGADEDSGLLGGFA